MQSTLLKRKGAFLEVFSIVKLDDFKAQIGNNEEAWKVVHNKHMEVVKQIKLLIVTYDKLKANSKCNQI